MAGEASIGKTIETPDPIGWLSRQDISFVDEDKTIKVELSGNFETVSKRLDSTNFELAELHNLSEHFQLEMNQFGENDYTFLGTKGHQSLRVIYEGVYVIIYDYYNGEGKVAPKLYVHGIYKCI